MSEPNVPPHDPSRGGKAEAGNGAHQSRPSDTELSRRLDELDASLGKVRSKSGEPAAKPGADTSAGSGAALAFRLGAEFVSGVLVGSLIGYGIDRFFAISPWGLIAFTLIGFAAGVMNMLRAAEGDSRRRSSGS